MGSERVANTFQATGGDCSSSSLKAGRRDFEGLLGAFSSVLPSRVARRALRASSAIRNAVLP